MTVAAILADKGRRVVTLTPDALLRDVARTLAEHRIGALVLVGPAGEIAGILSERDLVRALAAEGAAALEARASAYMSAKVTTCTEHDTIDTVMQGMTTGRFRHMPVTNNGRLIGVVSIGDVVKRRIDKADREAEEMRSYIATA